MCPISVALRRTRHGPHHCAACRRGERSTTAPGSPASTAVPPENQCSVRSRHYHIVPGSRPARQNRQSARSGRLNAPLLPAVLLAPPAAHARPPSRATSGPQLGESATRSRSGTPGAGLGERGRGGAGRGERERSRELPSRAERSRAVRCLGEAGRACRRLCTLRAAFPGSVSPPAFAQAPAKLLLSRDPSTGCVTK